MDCKTATSLLEAYLDGELDRELARELEAHVDTCADCQAALADLDRIRHAIRAEAPRYAAPVELRERIKHSLAEAHTARRRPRHQWLMAAGFAMAFLAGGLVTALSMRARGHDDEVARDLFVSHWRSLAATSPVDVVSSDRHTVKPWFAGKLAEAPLVKDFVEQGFALVGGRIDYAGTGRMPVLVYRHGQHLIDVFVLTSDMHVNASGEHREGYALVGATLGGQPAAIVSDLDDEELAKFRQLLDDAK
ncbi:MAG TPA: anti-sigma factor [Rhodanobacteraceae bacterium]|jgi:mycothiol system anti-sigma-R factor|nr:anti-sigma factor [Rhodanobacteraceae bacterium]